MPPLVSILIPSFNHGRYVKRCIDSVINQDHDNIELIIIDDGSSDDSVKVIEGMAQVCRTRFTRFLFRARGNFGLSETINEALEWSKGSYFSAIASDDVLHVNKTSSLLAQIEGEEDVAGIFGGCQMIDSTGAIVSVLRPMPKYYSFEDVLTNRHIIVAPSQLLRLQALRDVGGYPRDLLIEDWYMWLALAKSGYKLKVVPDILVQYRQHDFNSFKNASKMYEARRAILSNYKFHPLYQFSMSQTCVSAAIDISRTSKVQSAKYLVDAMMHSRRILLTRMFISGFSRLFIPNYVVVLLSRLKRWMRLKQLIIPRAW